MKVYYNDTDRFSNAWLEELIHAGELPAGWIDERSINDVSPDEIKNFKVCHFFSGIGGWAEALRLARWPADVPVWTGSCPCQPFSVAGLGHGHEDERHLWPEFARLICQLEPPIIFGEQVASKSGREWLTGIRLDLETMGYAVGSADLCAASVAAPHRRQRLYWVAVTNSKRFHQQRLLLREKSEKNNEAPRSGHVGRMADSDSERRLRRERPRKKGVRDAIKRCPQAHPMGNPNSQRLKMQRNPISAEPEFGSPQCSSPWSDSYNIKCGQRKYRRIPTEPALFPLADGIPNRVGTLRGAGNAIVPQVAAIFITSVMEIL